MSSFRRSRIVRRTGWRRWGGREAGVGEEEIKEVEDFGWEEEGGDGGMGVR